MLRPQLADENPSRERLAQPSIILTILASMIAFALVFKSPELTAFFLSTFTRVQQFSELYAHLDLAFVRTQAEILQNFSGQMIGKGDFASFELRPQPSPFGMKLRYMFMVASTDISIIIPTLNEEKYLSKCLSSLTKQMWSGRFEIIVVDGGSTDHTAQIAKKYADEVTFEPGRPVGAARNRGARIARGEILAFIDADTVASRYWLEAISQAFLKKRASVGLTGPTLPYDGRLFDSITYRLWTIYLQRILLNLGMPHVIGFNCAYRRKQFLLAGGFDEINVMSEDIALARKIRKYGKITFERQMYAVTSARRFKKYGSTYIGALYLLNGFLSLFLGKSRSNYPPVR
jgi:hypothetical protein